MILSLPKQQHKFSFVQVADSEIHWIRDSKFMELTVSSLVFSQSIEE